MQQKMPVGVDDFKELREGYYFVDKTAFIAPLVRTRSKVTLFTRPRRFGKTLTLSMLDYFFSIDKNKDSENLFQGLQVEQAGPDVMAQRGQYPVLFLSFKEIKNLSWDDMLKNLRNFISSVCLRYEFLEQSSKVQPLLRERFHALLYRQAGKEDMVDFLALLMAMLGQQYGKKVILLLDEYDAPIQSAWEHGYYAECIDFMKQCLGSALKGNPDLEFGVLTGVLRVAKESIFSGLNNLDVCSVTTEKYRDVFGFTPDEVNKIAADTGHADKLPEIRKWYDGYRFAQKEIYNPWSVICYFSHNCQPRPYWVNTSANGILGKLLLHTDPQRNLELQGLLEGKTVNVTLNEGVIYPGIGQDKSALYTLLLTTGYLTVEAASPISFDRFALRIPNEEIKWVYSKEILDHLAAGVDRDRFDDLFDALFAGQAETFERQLQSILLSLVSTYDTANKESFYHGLMLGMTALFLGKQYRILSNRESGYGRFDVAILPMKPEQSGVILEFKAAGSEKDLEKKAKEALEQIEAKKYDTDLQNLNLAPIWKYGISFYGKKVKVLGK